MRLATTASRTGLEELEKQFSKLQIKPATIAPYPETSQQALTDPDLAWIAKDGRKFRQVVKRYNGPEGRCHWNTAQLYDAKYIDHIVIGYAHNAQGWHQHTWGLLNGGVVETTPSNFENDLWFGVVLNPSQSRGFVKLCKDHKPGEGKVRSRLGGSIQSLRG